MVDKRKAKNQKSSSHPHKSKPHSSSKPTSPFNPEFTPSIYGETNSAPTSPPPSSSSSHPEILVKLEDTKTLKLPQLYHTHTEPEIEEEYNQGRKTLDYSTSSTYEKESLEISNNLQRAELESEREDSRSDCRNGRSRDVKLLWTSIISEETGRNMEDWSIQTWGKKLPEYKFGKRGEEGEKEGREWSRQLERLRL